MLPNNAAGDRGDRGGVPAPTAGTDGRRSCAGGRMDTFGERNEEAAAFALALASERRGRGGEPSVTFPAADAPVRGEAATVDSSEGMLTTGTGRAAAAVAGVMIEGESARREEAKSAESGREGVGGRVALDGRGDPLPPPNATGVTRAERGAAAAAA